MKLKQWQKNIISALVISVGGFALFNIAFLLAALVTNVTVSLLGTEQNAAPPMVGRVLFILLIILISWFVYRSRLNVTIKATYFTMPLMIIFVMLGLFIYQQSKWIIAGTGVVVICAVLLFFYKKKLSWQYYFSTFYVGALALYILLSGMDI